MRFKKDIELLTKATESLETVQKNFTSDLFKGETIKELQAFRRLLVACEMDLTQTPAKPVAFAQKIRYFPAIGVEEIGKILQNDGIHFATEEEINHETAKLTVRTLEYKRARKHLFSTQDIFLAKVDDAELTANKDRFFKMLPQPLVSQTVLKLRTDSFGPLRKFVRVAALLYHTGTNAEKCLLQNRLFYGLKNRGEVRFVLSLIAHTRLLSKDGLTLEDIKNFLIEKKALTHPLPFELYCQMLFELHSSLLHSPYAPEGELLQ